ncbi:hypothetical protein L5515_009639 [Caenorhabditis briggsae]|uniref:C-type lectin domain-containing protein n=1 Tax=Caenorhabditis briggsae TaxID=6238 RepID=A0AAE9F9A1_CAEBR|nr:hypothetical protein L5515_009639 [Caenorhabditis briggsae]
MLKIFGKVLDFDLKDAESDENCTQTCFSDSDCILAFFNEESNYLLFFYNSTETLKVEETNRDDGFFVAFKTNLSTSDLEYCPIESEISPKIFLGEDPISWTKTSDSTWQFKKCVGNWKMFNRSNPEIIVCMQVFLTGTGTTQKEAKDYCSSMGKLVTGVATVQEPKWILSKLQGWLPEVGTFEGIWIDGERKTLETISFTWTDGYTEGYRAFESGNGWLSLNNTKGEPENCLAVSIAYGRNARINDVVCGIGTGKELGVACGYKLE